MTNQDFINMVTQFSMNVMSTSSTDIKNIYYMCNISLINLFQKMNLYTTVWKYSLEVHDVVGLQEITLTKDPLKIIEVSSKSSRKIRTKKVDIDMITDGNGGILSDEEITGGSYSINGKEIKFSSSFTGKIYYVRKPVLISDANLAENVDFPDEALGYMLFHCLFGLMPFVLQEGRTLANGHYEHAKELFMSTVSLMNDGITSFTTK